MASGLAYGALGSVLALGAIALFVDVLVVDALGVPLPTLVFLAGLVVSYYGMYLLVVGYRAPVNEDLDGFLLPVLGALDGTSRSARTNAASLDGEGAIEGDGGSSGANLGQISDVRDPDGFRWIGRDRRRRLRRVRPAGSLVRLDGSRVRHEHTSDANS